MVMWKNHPCVGLSSLQRPASYCHSCPRDLSCHDNDCVQGLTPYWTATTTQQGHTRGPSRATTGRKELTPLPQGGICLLHLLGALVRALLSQSLRSVGDTMVINSKHTSLPLSLSKLEDTRICWDVQFRPLKQCLKSLVVILHQ